MEVVELLKVCSGATGAIGIVPAGGSILSTCSVHTRGAAPEHVKVKNDCDRQKEIFKVSKQFMLHTKQIKNVTN